MNAFFSLSKSSLLIGALAATFISCSDDQPQPASRLSSVSHQIAQAGDVLVLNGQFFLNNPELYLGAVRLPLTKTSTDQLEAVIPAEASSERLLLKGKDETLEGPLLEIYDKGWRRPLGPGTDIDLLKFLPENPAIGWAFGRIQGYPHFSIWRTQNGGASWTRTDLTQLSVPELHSFEPVSPQVVWASYYQQVFKSTDGGQSWTEQQFDLPYIEKVSFLDELTGFAVTRTTAGSAYQFMRTLDGGQSWQKVFEREFQISENRFSPVSASRLAYLDYQYQQIYLFDKNSTEVVVKDMPRLLPNEAPVSLTNGQQWFAGGSTSAVFGKTLPGSNTMIFSENNLLWTSANGGINWQKVSIPGFNDWQELISITTEGSKIWALTGNGDVLRSEDGGAHWTAKVYDRYDTEGVEAIYLHPLGKAFLITGYGELYMMDTEQ